MIAAFYCVTGGADIAKASSFLRVPGSKLWERVFARHSSKMCGIISSVVNEEIRTSLKGKFMREEIKKTTTALFAKDDENIHALIRKVDLTVSYDMGWQKQSTGKLNDSLSGHGFIFGCKTGNIIGFRVKSKACSTCLRAKLLNVPPPDDYDCRINWDGSSGAIEASVALEL